MSNKELIELMKRQLDQQQEQISLQNEQFEIQGRQNQHQIDAIILCLKELAKPNNTDNSTDRPTQSVERPVAEPVVHYSVPSFPAFEPSKELRSDYYLRFQTFVKAHSVTETKMAQVFLTNQSAETYKVLQNFIAQQPGSSNINDANLETLTKFMAEQFDPSYS